MIRKYNSEDAKSVKFIAYTEEQRGSMRAVCAVRCDYYIDNEPEHCFVMTDEFDRPAGFLLCSVNRDKFAALYPAYLSIAKEEDKKLYRAQRRLQKKLNSVPSQFAAHMVISVLPAFRGKGSAKALVSELVAHLRAANISGVYTVTDSPAALAFCERIGFRRVMHINKNLNVYGMEL